MMKNLVYADKVTEMLVGDSGAISSIGKMVVIPKSSISLQDKTDASVLLVGGIVISSHGPFVTPESESDIEMWEGNFIFIPRSKKKPLPSLKGLSIEQLVLKLSSDGNWESY